MRVGVVGGGIFGTYIASKIATKVKSVSLFEANGNLMSKASAINQARLHTGMHYPRDIGTASSTLKSYRRFINEFEKSVKYFNQYYAVAKEGSKISPDGFLDFARLLGIHFEIEEPKKFFKNNMADLLIRVPEATFDIEIIKDILIDQARRSGVKIYVNSPVEQIYEEDNLITVESNSSKFQFDKLIITTYGMSKVMANNTGIDLINIENQICEVLLGNFTGFENIGLTLMDGDFWSTMPFGSSQLHSLTHVKLTPLNKNNLELLDCQKQHGKCGKIYLYDCNKCPERPSSNRPEIIEEVNRYLLNQYQFNFRESKYAVKSIPSPKVNPADARPTIISKNVNNNIVLVFAGKISTIMEIDMDGLIED
jgi:hypothetical protein